MKRAQTIDVIVPDGGDALPGALYVEAEADNGGYSYSYMNCKDNIFISSFNSNNDAYKSGGTGDISTTNAEIPSNEDLFWCTKPLNIRLLEILEMVCNIMVSLLMRLQMERGA